MTPNVNLVIKKDDRGYWARLLNTTFCLADPLRSQRTFERSLQLMRQHKSYELVLSSDGCWSCEEGHHYEELTPAVFLPPCEHGSETMDDWDWVGVGTDVPVSTCHLDLDILNL